MRSPRLRVVLVLFCAACGDGSTPESTNAQLPSTGYLVYVRDREGSVLAAVDDQGKTLSLTVDDGFGLRLSATGTPVPREFLDKELDEETGYYRFQQRYYDPATAQWISPDPKVLANLDCSALVQGCHPYAFAGNRPLEWTDADGREVLSFIAADGIPTTIITAGFYGVGAAQARDVFLQAVSNVRGPVRIIAYTAVYKDRADVPEGLTPVEVDDAHTRGDNRQSSETAGNLQVIYLGHTALSSDVSETARGDEMLHEFQHAGGHLSEGYGYDPTGKGFSKPGHENGVGGFYLDHPDDTRFTHQEVYDLLHPEAPDLMNRNGTSNDPSFQNDPSYKSAQGGANEPGEAQHVEQ